MAKINPKLAWFLSDLDESDAKLTMFILHSGGAIAISHPLGMSTSTGFHLLEVFRTHCCIVIAGVRQVVTGLAELKRRNAQILCTSMCIGSGMGAAAIFVNERVDEVN